MRKIISLLPLFLVAIVFLIPGPGYGQYLVTVEHPEGVNLDDSQIRWFSRQADLQFLLLTDLQLLQNRGINFTVLDDDVEGGYFYWIQSVDFIIPDWPAMVASTGAVLLWEKDRLALVRVESPAFLNDLPSTVNRQKIIFRKFPAVPESVPGSGIPHPDGITTVMQAILDSVDINRIYLTEEHLSGESPYLINAALDSMQSRNSDHPHIFKAQNYLSMRLEELGYTAELHPFSMGGVFYDVQFAPGQSDTGWVCTTDRIYGTTNGGLTWTSQYSGSTGGDIWSLYPLTGNLCYAVGDYGTILRTTDGGISWQSQAAAINMFHFGVFFRNPDLGWIASDNGYTFKTTDGGATWLTRTTPTTNRLYDIFFIDDLNGWAAGRSGAIVHTTNGGETWQTQSSGTTSRLYGVHFLNPDTGFAVGWDGRVLRTTNGGSNWTQLSIPYNTYFYDIDFLDPLTGIIVGWDGNCLITTNGGSNWSPAANILSRDVYGMDLVTASIVWSSGDALVARSENFAASWQMQIQNIPEGSLNNVLATKVGTTYPDQYYIICAHYDDMPSGPIAPGADDNASGTATVIEAARVLAPYDFAYSIRFLMVSGEEQGLIGSAAYASGAASAGDQIRGVINMDMIGYDGNNDGRMEIHAGTMMSSQEIGQMIRNNITNWNLNLVVDYLTSGSTTASDHASFWSAGYPAVLLIEDFQDFTPWYHTTNDQLSTLRPSYFLENARLAIGSIAMLAQIDSAQTGIAADQVPADFRLYEPYPNPFNPTVTVQYELPQAGEIRVEVYDVLGQKVRELVNQKQEAGLHAIDWHADNSGGAMVGSGIYIIRMTAGPHVATRKVVLLR